MCRTGKHKDPDSIEQRLKRLGFEPTAFGRRNWHNPKTQERIMTTSAPEPGIGHSGKKRDRVVVYRLISKDNEVDAQAQSMVELVGWLEAKE